MSSSSSPPRIADRRVLRRSNAAPAEPSAALLSLDLAGPGLARLDPARIDEAVAEGYAAGFDAGKAAGLEAGRRAAAGEMEQASAVHAARLAGIVAKSEAAIRELVAAVVTASAEAASATTAAAFTIAEAVVGRELQVATDPVRDAVTRALALAPEGMELRLRLDPSDAADLDVASLPADRAIVVVPDASVAPGDCVAEAGWTRVDARIAEALDRVRSVLEGAP